MMYIGVRSNKYCLIISTTQHAYTIKHILSGSMVQTLQIRIHHNHLRKQEGPCQGHPHLLSSRIRTHLVLEGNVMTPEVCEVFDDIMLMLLVFLMGKCGFEQ